MIHGPCGVQNPSCVCMEAGECKNNFPKPFRDETAENINGYPAYRRRNDGRTVQIGGLVAENSYVVPYNKQLLRKYRTHINVEACATVDGQERQVPLQVCLQGTRLCQHGDGVGGWGGSG